MKCFISCNKKIQAIGSISICGFDQALFGYAGFQLVSLADHYTSKTIITPDRLFFDDTTNEQAALVGLYDIQAS